MGIRRNGMVKRGNIMGMFCNADTMRICPGQRIRDGAES